MCIRDSATAELHGIRFHDLRHTYAVNAIRAGDDIKTVQGNLGHASAAVSYTHLSFSRSISICWALSCRKISISSMLVPGLLFFFFIGARVCNQVANVRALAAFIQIGAVYRVQHRAQALERVQAR